MGWLHATHSVTSNSLIRHEQAWRQVGWVEMELLASDRCCCCCYQAPEICCCCCHCCFGLPGRYVVLPAQYIKQQYSEAQQKMVRMPCIAQQAQYPMQLHTHSCTTFVQCAVRNAVVRRCQRQCCCQQSLAVPADMFPENLEHKYLSLVAGKQE